MQDICTVVYYCDAQGVSHHEVFEGDAVDVVGPALSRVQELRSKGMRHVVSSTENSMSVGKPGVDVVGPDYDWKKRRQ